jgi:cysteine desulfurase/selenocysteine lyase
MLDSVLRQRDFPTLAGRAYLNTAAESIPPVIVGEAMARYFRGKQRGMEGREQYNAELAAARELAGRMVGLSAEEVGFCANSKGRHCGDLGARICQRL